MDVLSTSGINNTISTYQFYEKQKKLTPLQNRRDQYSGLTSAWSGLQTKLTTLQSLLSDLKSTTASTNKFNSKTATLSNSNFFSVSTTSNAVASNYNLRVNQLAKNDLLVSQTFSSGNIANITAGKHTIAIQSGDFSGKAEIEVTGTETYNELMSKIQSSINQDKAVVKSSGSGTYTLAGKLNIDVNGTVKEIDYDYSNKTYAEIVSDLVQKINTDVTGVLAEEVDGNLQLTVTNSNNYISISDASGTLANTLGLEATKEKGLSSLVNVSLFIPSTGNSKLSIEAKNSGYDNRLIMSDFAGEALNKIGLTSAILTDRTSTSGDDSAGFKFVANSISDNQLNSKISFNGININRNTNTISDLVNGLTFTLKATMLETDTDVTLKIENDDKENKARINNFITKFNEAYLQIRNNYFSTKGNRGVFVGDPVALGLMNNMKNLATANVSGIETGKINNLQKMGISFNPDIGLTINNSSLLDSVLADKLSEIEELFSASDGIANKLHSALELQLGTNGAISNIMKGYENNIKFYNDRIKSTTEQIDKSADVLRKKYEQMQMEYAQFLDISNYFNSMTEGMF